MQIKNITYFKSLIQFVAYSIIGCSNVIINISIINILSYLTQIYSGPFMYLFDALAFMAYSINGYILNNKFTFKCHKPKKNSYLKYASVLGISAFINSTIFTILTMTNVFNISKILWLNISKLIASITVGIMTFLVNKYFVFKDKTKYLK